MSDQVAVNPELPANVSKFLANESIIDYALQASRRCGVFPSVILAQWGNETAWGTSEAWTKGKNFAGVSSNGVVLSYTTYAQGLAAYEWVLLRPLYNPIRLAKKGGAIDQAKALGESPWAGGHYEGDGAYAYPGGALVEEITDYGLERFDDLDTSNQAPPVVSPPDQTGPTFAKLDASTAARITLDAFRLVLNRAPTAAEDATWVDAFEGGTHEPADLVIELSAEPQSFVSPLEKRA